MIQNNTGPCNGIISLGVRGPLCVRVNVCPGGLVDLKGSCTLEMVHAGLKDLESQLSVSFDLPVVVPLLTSRLLLLACMHGTQCLCQSQ